MKLSKIGALCRAAKHFIIYRSRDGRQWLSDGYAIFPLKDMPLLSADNVLTIFDVPEEKRGRMLTEETDKLPDSLDLSDSVDDEIGLTQVPMVIRYRGAAYSPFFARGRVIFVECKYLSCFGDSVELFARMLSSEKMYVAVKKGFFLQGVILPAEVASEQLASWLSDMGEAIADEVQPKELDTSDI